MPIWDHVHAEHVPTMIGAVVLVIRGWSNTDVSAVPGSDQGEFNTVGYVTQWLDQGPHAARRSRCEGSVNQDENAPGLG